MNIRAVLFDVYATILEVGPPPANAEALWARLFDEMLGTKPLLSRTDFSVGATQVIAHQHAEARARGIPWPEILWPAVVLEIIPALSRLSAPKLEEFLLRQMQIGRTLRLADGTGECLRWLHERKRLLGIASNSQSYTLRELDGALRGVGLDLSLFDRAACFWSFENGFSKPDPHVFRILTTRLKARGISPAETLMVGDHLDNDLEPARAFGWQTWQLVSTGSGGSSGNWRELLSWLKSNP